MNQSMGVHAPSGTVGGLQAGEMLAGKYRLERLIGRGGMGAVFAATQVDLGRTVAIKVLLPELLDEAARARFSREARVLAGLRSEHVTVVHDLGKLDSNAPYIVMEFLEGKDLHALLDDYEKLPISDATHYVRQACDALTEAHSHGIIHRDLKPANLFLTRRADGSPLVKLLDFGISKSTNATDPNFNATATMTVLGSPSYMSPEQLVSTKTVDLRTDIWALGATLCELVTGRPPFDAPTIAELALKIHLSAPIIAPELPASLRAVIERCLHKDPEQRYQSAAELSRALAEFDSANAATTVRLSLPAVEAQTANIGPAQSEPKPETKTASSWGTTLERKKSRSSRFLILGAVALVTIAGASVIGFMLTKRADDAGSSSASAAPVTEPARPPEPTVSNAEPAHSISAAAPAAAPAAPTSSTTPSVEPSVAPDAKAPSQVAAPSTAQAHRPSSKPATIHSAKPSAAASAKPAPAPAPTDDLL